MEDQQRNKGHKSHNVGAKASKKTAVQKQKKGIEAQPNRGNNPKAFLGPATGSHKVKTAMQSMEKREHVLHIPDMDHTLADVLEEPPLLVAVVGPPGCGKTTLIRSLVKFYSGRNIQKIRGPITVIAGRSRRLTFLECPNTLSAMCDVAKVADLVLLVVDGSYGFEMETFEFLNIAQIHGFPRIIGIVSHLDTLKSSKALKKRKKFLRHRFWHEVADGAKMLCLAPMIGNFYRGTDVLKLHQLLICVNTRIQNWRNSHSCVVVDRFEDLTNPDLVAETPNTSRTIAFFGFVRGKPTKPNQMLHIPGLGDFPAKHISRQDDPCSFDNIKKGTSQGHKMRHLSAKQKKLYAPYCDIGGVVYDEDAIYVHEDGERANIERSGEGFELMRELQRVKVAVDERNEHAELDVVAGQQRTRRPVNFTSDESLELAMHDSDVEQPADFRPEGYTYDDDDSGDDDDDEDEPLWDHLAQNDDLDAEALLRQYGQGDDDGDGDEDDDDQDDDDEEGNGLRGEKGAMPYLIKEYEMIPRLPDDVDTVKVTTLHHDWTNPALLARVKNLFVTGKWKKEEGGLGLGDDDDVAGDAEADDLDDKGYDSDDQEFQQLIRGEKPLDRKKLRGEDGSENDEEDDDDNINGGESAVPVKRPPMKANALAGVKSSAGGKSRYTGGAPAGWQRDDDGSSGPDGDDSEDDYDILNDDDDEDGAKKGSYFADSELQGLVDHFVTSDRNGPPTLSFADSLLDNDDEASSYRHNNGGGEAAGKGPRRGGKKGAVDDEAELANVAPGSELNAEQADYLKKKMAKKQSFDDDYDTGKDGTKNNATMGYYRHLIDAKDQKEKDMKEALSMVGEDLDKKIALVGFFSGLYVRVVIENIPVEFLRNFDPRTPVIIGGLNAGEDQLELINAKVKRHRWYPRILKAQDPILISMGWRRFQTQPIFAAEDPNGRLRYLKYTPLHMHCYASFYGPAVPPNTGFIVIPVQDKRTPFFRPTCTGYTIGNDSSTQIVKKLKLTGYPDKVQKTTCFVKGMFNSDVEAAKFVGAKVKAVSGLRGIIKAVIKGKNGIVRCTFEDKVLTSDIVFLRAWKGVDPPRYCAMAPTLLDPNWVGMRPMAQLRREMAADFPMQEKPDSEYREVKRRRKVSEDEPVNVAISRNMRRELPFNFKEDYIALEKASSHSQRRVIAATTVAPEVREMRRNALLDVFEGKANKMDAIKKANAKVKKDRNAKVTEREEEEYGRKLKKAKKETARKAEFRSQHKSRK